MPDVNPTKVVVFGGAQPIAGQPAYEQSYRLGKALGKQGYSVITGGYVGTMEGVSKGAAEAGAHVIGITCEEIEVWRKVRPNPWVAEEIRCVRLHERIITLIEQCHAAIALPGGVGTLAEILCMWNLLEIQAVPEKPLVLVGSGWEQIIRKFKHEMDGYLSDTRRDWLFFARDEIQAVDFLAQYKF